MNISEQKQIRSLFNDQTIRVYQAYSDAIADAALKHGTFISPPFKIDRMTWIKPSFLWMMYRAGWGYKDPQQKRILAIDISHEGFNWALTHSCESRAPALLNKKQWQELKHKFPVRIQWDPERDINLQPLPYRSIQIGLSKIAVNLYINQWIKKITDITPLAHSIYTCIQSGEIEQAKKMLPEERIYPILENN